MPSNAHSETDKKRILVLTADAGFGHRSAAKAIVAALEDKYGHDCEVVMVNPLNDERAPALLRDSQTDYDFIIQNIPRIYRIGYEVSDAAIPATLAESASIVLLYDVLRDLLDEYQPDAIITTYPAYQAPLSAIFAIEEISIPLITVITDLVTVHRLWFNHVADVITVATPDLKDLAEEYGMEMDRVHITGIPVHPRIANESRTKEAIREELGWDPTLPTFLAVGSTRVEQLTTALNVLNHFGQPLQIAAVAGKDEELHIQLKEMDWHVPVHIYGFVENMPALMHASDAILCKAGGLITTEALASGLPIILIEYIAGQETGNMEYVVNNQAGALVQEPVELLELLAHWMQDGGAKLKICAENARKLGKPHAACHIADLTWEAIQHGVTTKHRMIPSRGALTKILDTFSMPWERK
ncbi:MAG: glycosyltransferase [Anaerolineaceae bacterium]|jgi:1,2-diacylglycerol 3-beta-galactosyltransferase|nr:glycosyltransferase [Anaerolineaceae bacterium]